jgi:TonB family protein
LKHLSPRNELGQIARQTKSESASSGFDDPSIPVGAETLLNMEQTIYYSFYSRLYQAIAPVWQSHIHSRYWGLHSRPLPGRYTTRVAVWLDRNGNLKSLQILEPSRIGAFDQAVLETWKRIDQFPNPPRGLMDGGGNVRTLWNFTVEVGETSGWNFLPPNRI